VAENNTFDKGSLEPMSPKIQIGSLAPIFHWRLINFRTAFIDDTSLPQRPVGTSKSAAIWRAIRSALASFLIAAAFRSAWSGTCGG
jgi:hypothetical protein